MGRRKVNVRESLRASFKDGIFASFMGGVMDQYATPLALFLGAALHAAPRIDWAKVNAETIQHFTSLLRIDTTNPPGNEIKAAEYIQVVLAK